MKETLVSSLEREYIVWVYTTERRERATASGLMRSMFIMFGYLNPGSRTVYRQPQPSKIARNR